MTAAPSELEQVTATLTELRQILEETSAHTKQAAERYGELRREFDAFAHDMSLEVRSLRKRLDEIRPVRLNCPHCGASVQKGWVNCKMCLKQL